METLPVIRKLCRPAQPTARCKSRTKQPGKKRTTGHCGNGFLNHQFKPVWGTAFRDWKKAENDFFSSLTNLCDFLGWTKPDVSGLSFPQNISAAYQQLIANNNEKDVNCLILQDKNHHATLATVKTFDTGYRLYYIPVRPVCKRMECDNTKPLAELLISVYRYLYHVTGVSYYRESGCLDYMYETLENWIDEDTDDEGGDFRNLQRKEIDNAKTCGDAFLKIIKQPFSAKAFASRIAAYHDSECRDIAFEELAQELFKFASDYPNRSIADSIPADFYPGEENETICLQHYLSFYWSGEDCLADTLTDMVNNELQEMGYQEEPVAVQWFDVLPDTERYDFDFEARLFALLLALTNYLSDYDNEQYQQ